MPSMEHQQAQELAAAAELATRQGAHEKARSLYEKAARFELSALRDLPPSKPRSLGILSVSYASLLFKAELYDQAELAIYGLLSDATIPAPFRDQLRELLQVTWEERLLLQDKMKYTGAEILVALRGGRIGMGTAPADTAVHYLNGFNLLAYRAAEYDAGLPLRKHGPPSKEIQTAFQARATQPAVGSYKFSIKLLEPAQATLFPETSPAIRPDPWRVSRIVAEVLRSVTNSDQGALERAVSAGDYRLALARLARNIVPAGESLSEVEIRLAGDGPLDAIRLIPAARRNVNETIRLLKPSAEQSSGEETITGTLRAVHLDQSWIRIVPDQGAPVRIRTNPDELDDVIGPMVNHKVIARIVRTDSKRARLIDVELQED